MSSILILGTSGAPLGVLGGCGLKPPPRALAYDISKVWQYLNFHQKEPIALTSIIGKTYYKSGAG